MTRDDAGTVTAATPEQVPGYILTRFADKYGRPVAVAFGILVSDLDEVVHRLAAAGQDVTWDEDFPGFRRVYARDPFGNRLEFMQPASR